jgi:hypothetical protein
VRPAASAIDCRAVVHVMETRMNLRDRTNGGTTTSGPDATVDTGRTPRSAPDRSALPEAWPRPVKLARGRTFEMPPPAHIRVIGAATARADRDVIARKLGMKLGKFGASIERVSVRLSDANGPKGGVDQVCRIKVVLSGLPSVLVERRDKAPMVAAEDAIRATALAVGSRVQRRRLKPLRRRSA